MTANLHEDYMMTIAKCDDAYNRRLNKPEDKKRIAAHRDAIHKKHRAWQEVLKSRKGEVQ